MHAGIFHCNQRCYFWSTELTAEKVALTKIQTPHMSYQIVALYLNWLQHYVQVSDKRC
jgi:hypothetical protein